MNTIRGLFRQLWDIESSLSLSHFYFQLIRVDGPPFIWVLLQSLSQSGSELFAVLCVFVFLTIKTTSDGKHFMPEMQLFEKFHLIALISVGISYYHGLFTTTTTWEEENSYNRRNFTNSIHHLLIFFSGLSLEIPADKSKIHHLTSYFLY